VYPRRVKVNGEFWEKTVADKSPDKPGIWRSCMFAPSYKDHEGKDESVPDFKRLGLEGRAYYGFRDFRMTSPTGVNFGENVRPDITVIPARMFGMEFARTEGHEHLSGLPEIYENILGNVGFLLFKPSKKNPARIKDAMLVVSEPGDHVLFPPGYAHITINLGKMPAIVTDLVSTEAKPGFEEIRKRSGGSHYITLGKEGSWFEVQGNANYEEIPELRIVRPASEIILPTGIMLRKGEPMFKIHSKGKVGPFMFLNDKDQGKYGQMYNRAFRSL